MVDKTCENCKHWKNVFRNYGECKEIESKLDLNIDSGWDGHVLESIETESDFGCTLHVSK